MTDPADQLPSEKEVFVTFHYQEVKDLAKHFLTLISATLVLSVTFADKIISFESAPHYQRWVLVSCWVLLIASLICAGFGLFRMFLAAEKAQGSLIYDYRGDFRSLARAAYFLLDVGAILYGGGLVLLASTGVIRLLLETP